MAEATDKIFEARKLRYEQLQQNRRSANELQGQYGRWLIASLLLVHGGSILLLAQSPDMIKTVLPAVFWWHIAGLVLALACGFTTWANWSYHIVLYDNVSPAMIYDDNEWPKFDPKVQTKIGWTHWSSITLGLLSGACILGAAICGYAKMGLPSAP